MVMLSLRSFGFLTVAGGMTWNINESVGQQRLMMVGSHHRLLCVCSSEHLHRFNECQILRCRQPPLPDAHCDRDVYVIGIIIENVVPANMLILLIKLT